MRTRPRILAAMVLAAAALTTPATPRAAIDPEQGDIRDLRLGQGIADLAGQGYVDLTCAAAPAVRLAGWVEYERCPAAPSGLREVGMRYDDSRQQWAAVNDKWEGTQLAGHPVLLSVLLDGGGVVRGIRALTDPDARPYLKKKAFLLAIRVKGRYGRDGWDCRENAPAGDRTPVGGMFIDELCEKPFNGRRLVLHTELYRAPGQEGREFTDRTRFEILAPASTG